MDKKVLSWTGSDGELSRCREMLCTVGADGATLRQEIPYEQHLSGAA